MESTDDFFDLPDESATSDHTIYNSSIFSELKNQSSSSANSRATAFENVLASLPKSSQTTVIKKPTVTFNDLPTTEASLLSPPRAPKSTISSLKKQSSFINFDYSTSHANTYQSKSAPSTISAIERTVENVPITTNSTAMSSALLDSLFSSQKIKKHNNTDELLTTTESTGTIASRRNKHLADENPSNTTTIQKHGNELQLSVVHYESLISSKDRELEELRREFSHMRFEKTEDHKTIMGLQKKLEIVNEEHQKSMHNLNEDCRKQIQELKRCHERQLEDLRIESVRNQEILSNIKANESSISNVEGRIGALNNALMEMHNQINKVCSPSEDVERIILFAEQKIQQNMKQFELEKSNWKHNCEETTNHLESEMLKLKTNYETEIIEGRRWIEEERTRLHSERVAFQEEQIIILKMIEQKSDELNTCKADFLSKEHDLLVRVVNEKAVLENQRREFERQRNCDVARLRSEAEHLEKCLLQVDNARNALTNARREYEYKNQQLNEIKEMLVEYEENRRKNKQNS